MGRPQGDISRLERAGADHRVSTLRRYAEALGGALEIVIALEGERYVVDLSAHPDDARRRVSPAAPAATKRDDARPVQKKDAAAAKKRPPSRKATRSSTAAMSPAQRGAARAAASSGDATGGRQKAKTGNTRAKDPAAGAGAHRAQTKGRRLPDARASTGATLERRKAAVLEAFAELDRRHRWTGLVPIPALRRELEPKLGLSHAEFDALLVRLSEKLAFDLKIANDHARVPDPEDGIPRDDGALWYFVTLR